MTKYLLETVQQWPFLPAFHPKGLFMQMFSTCQAWQHLDHDECVWPAAEQKIQVRNNNSNPCLHSKLCYLQTWVDFFWFVFLFFLERTTHSKAVQTAALARCCSTSSFVSAQRERCSFITAWDLHPCCRCDFGQMYRVSAKQIELRGPWGKKRCRIYGGV